jgi:hypothetical protein
MPSYGADLGEQAGWERLGGEGDGGQEHDGGQRETLGLWRGNRGGHAGVFHSGRGWNRALTA